MALKSVKKEEVEKKQPVFIARCKQSEDSEYWMTAGAAWEANFKDGSKGYSLKLNNLPVGWNGDLLLMPPKED